MLTVFSVSVFLVVSLGAWGRNVFTVCTKLILSADHRTGGLGFLLTSVEMVLFRVEGLMAVKCFY